MVQTHPGSVSQTGLKLLRLFIKLYLSRSDTEKLLLDLLKHAWINSLI